MGGPVRLGEERGDVGGKTIDDEGETASDDLERETDERKLAGIG